MDVAFVVTSSTSNSIYALTIVASLGIATLLNRIPTHCADDSTVSSKSELVRSTTPELTNSSASSADVLTCEDIVPVTMGVFVGVINGSVVPVAVAVFDGVKVG